MTETLKLGIDDAGRGPVIGPMILAGCLINAETEAEFKKVGVKDSKQLTPKRREHIANIIREKAETFELQVVHPKEIDGDGDNFGRTNLNNIEAIKCAAIINKINKGYGKIKVVIDCPSPNLGKWTDFVKAHIDNLSNLEISCEHKADKNHISVSAASILAKSLREKEMDKIREKFGEEVGSGYPADPLTKRFLEKQGRKHKDAGIIRKTWMTWKSIFAGKEQKTLGF
jgi:ribonuclease HII